MEKGSEKQGPLRKRVANGDQKGFCDIIFGRFFRYLSNRHLFFAIVIDDLRLLAAVMICCHVLDPHAPSDMKY